MKTGSINPASFRDPSGFVFSSEGVIYRQVNLSYRDNFDFLVESGLFKNLVTKGLIVGHEEVSGVVCQPEISYKILEPKKIPFISYPYEWCFSQLKDAALATLRIQKIALEYGMSLKDCSAYNIQFVEAKPVLIDTLSFEKYEEGRPWVAYRQFCQHFLAPLTLACYKDIRLIQLLRVYIDGIPLDLASSCLPLVTRFRPGLLFHIHLHAKFQKIFSSAQGKVRYEDRKFTRNAMLSLINNLESVIRGLRWKLSASEWGDYYNDTNYSEVGLGHKKELVSMFLDIVKPKSIWDLGANNGLFSRLSVSKSSFVVSMDIDPICVENNYLTCVRNKETNIIPLVIDLTNPSAGFGWENKERLSIIDRGPAEVVLALALIHHLAISNNLTFEKIAKFFYGICNFLIIEFVPKSDSQVQRLLSNRKDIFNEYTITSFEKCFTEYFNIQQVSKVSGTERTLYLMSRKYPT